jgi:HEAT repeat protein
MALGRRTSGIETSREEVVAVAQAALPLAGRGIADKDPLTRRASLEVIQAAATGLTDLIVDPSLMVRSEEELPPPGRKLTLDEQQVVDKVSKALREEWQAVLPLVRALVDQTAPVTRALADSDQAVCQTACEALETLAATRLRLNRQAVAAARFSQPGAKEKLFDDLLQPALRGAVPGLVSLLSHKEVPLRLAALYVLETLEGEAAPATDALIKALQDENPFVRWGAVRALGKIAPIGADKAVVPLAKLLDDDNGDVRITTVAALTQFGPAAKTAAPALGKVATGAEEPEMRVAALQALAAIGPDAQPAVADMAKALTASEKNVRTAAAEALGKLGPSAKGARDALLKALNDPDAEVRLAAGEALLNILPAVKGK